MQHKVEAKASAIESLRSDNVKLYEKIRFLESYSGKR